MHCHDKYGLVMSRWFEIGKTHRLHRCDTFFKRGSLTVRCFTSVFICSKKTQTHIYASIMMLLIKSWLVTDLLYSEPANYIVIVSFHLALVHEKALFEWIHINQCCIFVPVYTQGTPFVCCCHTTKLGNVCRSCDHSSSWWVTPWAHSKLRIETAYLVPPLEN